MSWLKTFKKIFKEENSKENNKIGTISIEQLSFKVEDKLKEYSERKEKVRKEIIERIYQFEVETQKSLDALEKVNLNERKEHEKIKLIVKENLNWYIVYLKRLINNLKNIENLEVENYINKVYLIIDEFNRSSYKTFEKATILVGEELAKTRSIIRDLIKDINRIVSKNKIAFEETKFIRKINLSLEELKQKNSHLESLDLRIIEVNDELNKAKKEYEKVKQKIIEIRESQDYKNDSEEKEKYKNKLHEIEKEIQSIRQKIDFRLLAKYFHYDDKKSQIIRDYSKNFKSYIENDENLSIIELVKEAQNIDLKHLKELRKRMIELNKPLITETDNKILTLEDDLKKIELGIINIENNINFELKKKERLKDKREKTMTEIKEISNSLFPNIKIGEI